MNTSQMAIQHQRDDPPRHGYNLRKCPTKLKEWISLAIAHTITGVRQQGQYTTIRPKPLAHIILTQIYIR